MSKINELVQTLCPDGVEYKILPMISVNCDRQRKAITSGKRIAGSTPYYGASGIVDYVEGYIFEGVYLLVSEDGANLLARSTPIAFSISGKTWVNNHAHVLKFENDVTRKFVEYFFNSIDLSPYITGGAQPKLNQDNLNSIEIPVPPLPVQEEIVRILDEYTELEAELEAKLSEEIELKQRQYEFYRACLFNVKNADILKIGDFTQVFSASRVHKSDWKSEGVRFWRSSDLMSYFNGVENPRGKVFISYELYEKLSAKSGKIRKYDILITGGGSIGVPYLVPDDEPLYVKDADLLCIQRNDRVDSEYLYFYFLTSEFRDYLKDITHDATIAHYTISQIKETPVPVPSMTEQRKIVKALKELKTEMDAIISTLNTELESRKKQYAYYRDQLLTFKRKE